MRSHYDFNEGERGAFVKTNKERITIRLDPDVINWFKNQVQGGGNYQSLINDALRKHMQRQGELLEDTLQEEIQTTDLQQLEKDEIIKVTRRLKLWITRPTQINSQILNSFLQLNDTHEKITIDLLRSSLPEINTFDSNLNQMGIIAERNHGKIFELNNNVVEIWKPIRPLINHYQNRLNTSFINLSVS